MHHTRKEGCSAPRGERGVQCTRREERGAMHREEVRRKKGCNAPNKAWCNAPDEKMVRCTGQRKVQGTERRTRKGEAQCAERGESEKGRNRHSPEDDFSARDLIQGAMRGCRLFGKSTYCVCLTWRRTVRALPWAWLECPDMSG